MDSGVERAFRECVRTVPSLKGLVSFPHLTQGLRPGLNNSAPAGLALGWVLSRDVAFQVPDGFFLTRDDPFHQIADRYHPHDGALLDYRKVPEMVIRHDGHALVDCVLGSHKDHRAGHNLPDRSLFRGPSLENDLAGIVTLREDPDELAFQQHQQGSDSLITHLLDGFVNGLIGAYRPNCPAGLLLQQRFNRVTNVHGSTCRVSMLARWAAKNIPQSFPIQDEPEGGGSFQYKMSLERVAC